MVATQTERTKGPRKCSSLDITIVEPWLDIVFPAATSLVLLNQATTANIILFIWICCRLTLFAHKQTPQNWVLLGLALVFCSTIVLDRGSQPSDLSDLLVIGLAFAAGLQRTQQQWQQSTALISTCLIPAVLTALHQGTGQLLQFPGFNVNRFSFFLGLIIISCYATCRWSASRLGLACLAAASIPLCLLTGSRAALAAPAISLAGAWAICRFQDHSSARKKKTKGITFAALALAALTLTGLTTSYFWYSTGRQSTENTVNDIKRFETAACWFNAPFKKGKPFSGLGLNEKVRSRCNGDHIPYMKKTDHNKGLPHAHNIFGQIMGETGLPGLTGLLGTMAFAIHAIRKQLKPKAAKKHAIRSIHLTLPLCIYLGATGMTTSFYIYLMLNQVLTGYLLGALVVRSPNKQLRPHLIAAASDQAAAT